MNLATGISNYVFQITLFVVKERRLICTNLTKGFAKFNASFKSIKEINLQMKRSFQISLSLNASIVQTKLMKSRHIKGNWFVDMKCFNFIEVSGQ